MRQITLLVDGPPTSECVCVGGGGGQGGELEGGREGGGGKNEGDGGRGVKNEMPFRQYSQKPI